MTLANLDIPDLVRRKARALGSEGEVWLRSLSDRIRDLEREWDIVAGAAIEGGTESYVASATLQDGALAVLKIELPGDTGFGRKVQTLVSANGRGYARLLRSDANRKAMLQERLGPSLALSGLPVAAQIEILCATLETAWATEVGSGLESGADKAHRLASFIAATWEALGRPSSEASIESALRLAEARAAAFDPDSAVVVHGDAHSGNALEDPNGPSGFKFVDPESFLAERAYDLGISMREWSEELLEGDTVQRGMERCALLGRLTGVELQPIWEWGFVERVSTGLFCLQVGYERLGREMLAVADVWACGSARSRR